MLRSDDRPAVSRAGGLDLRAKLPDMHSLRSLVDAHVVLAIEQQLHFADVVGEHAFAADLDAGTISFGDELSYRCELIGTKSPESGTWMWGWANPAGFGEHITASTRALRAHGEAQDIAALTRGEVPLDDEVSGHRMAAVAVGHAQASAYYSVPTDGDARAYLLVDGPGLGLPAPEVTRLVSTLTLLLEGGGVHDWAEALERFASRRELIVARDGGAIRLEGPELNGHVRVALDELGRVAEISGRTSEDGEADADAADGPDLGDAGTSSARRGLLGRLRRR